MNLIHLHLRSVFTAIHRGCFHSKSCWNGHSWCSNSNPLGKAPSSASLVNLRITTIT